MDVSGPNPDQGANFKRENMSCEKIILLSGDSEKGRAKRPGFYEKWEAKKEAIWNYMVALPKKEKPYGCTIEKLAEAKQMIMKDTDFWHDIINRHGLTELDKTIEQLKEKDLETYNHCVGNFWGMLMEKMWKNGIFK